MVVARALSPLCNYSTLLACAQHKYISFHPSSLTPSSYKPNASASVLSNHKCLKDRNGVRAFAAKKRRKDKVGVLERESFENDGYEFEEDVNEDDDGDEDEEELLMPMEKMRQWLENRPAGFGQGKAYDTTVEDKLLDEMQQSRVAQLANINKLKHNPIPPGGGGGDKAPPKASEVVTPAGVRVRLLNLPKKKNIHRDLQLAFKEVPGIISISPAVTGTKKTRDPICKGYGFVYFKSEVHANRFIQIFATANIAFGKIQKQIKCELASPSSKDDALDIPMTNTLAKSSLPVLSYHEDETIIAKINNLSYESLKETESNEPHESESESDTDSDASYDSNADISESPEPAIECTEHKSTSATSKSSSSKQETKPPAKKKLVAVKAKGPKPAKLGSANKLKSKDRSVLTGVFSKYGAKAQSMASKDS
ncbi:unnamed protein product [Rhodiola kirilowii]